MGGVGLRLQEEQEVDQRNFTGCIRVQISAAVVGPPEAPKCIGRTTEVTACTYCSTHEVSWPYRYVELYLNVCVIHYTFNGRFLAVCIAKNLPLKVH